MDLKKEKNRIKNFEGSNFVRRKSLFIENDNIISNNYSKNTQWHKNRIIQLSSKKSGVNETDKKSSLHYMGNKNLSFKKSLFPHVYSFSNIFAKEKLSKRIVDIVIALIALLVLFPVFIVIAYKVRKNLGSPIFFYQERPGKNGKLFKMI